ncbi:MAG: hypothetical protein ACR2PF_20970 [Rhizobiaceae bacterium]
MADRLRSEHYVNPVVIALPRGGVPVASEVADALGAQLDVVLVRKIGPPGHRELATAAVVDGETPELVVNEDVLRMAGLGRSALDDEMKSQLREIERRRL